MEIFILKIFISVYVSLGVLHCMMVHYECNFGKCAVLFHKQIADIAKECEEPEWSVWTSLYIYSFLIGVFLILDFMKFLSCKFGKNMLK